MTIWIATIDWDHSPETGLPQQGYTVLLPERREADRRVMDCLNVVTGGADPETAIVASYSRTATATRAVVTLAGMRFDYRILEHDGTLKNPGFQVKAQ